MIAWIVFIILIILEVVFCNSLSNLSNYDLYSIHPVSLFRNKRNNGNPEYTRWRANEETTHEFIVKVLDDDIIAPITKKVIAVNIEQKAKGGEKIIIGGAIAPQRAKTLSASTVLFKDYTRFVPPTTGAITNSAKSLYLEPAPLSKIADNLSPILPRVGHGNSKSKNSQRDESPPAGPQFLLRTPQKLARQYAPIVQVAFSQRTTYAPLTPPFTDLHMIRDKFVLPPRTTPLIDLTIPTRTIYRPKDIQSFTEEEVDLLDEYLTRTTSSPFSQPERTSREEFKVSNLDGFELPIRKSDTSKQKTDEKIVDAAYIIPFYRDEENDETVKIDNKDISDEVYLDKTQIDSDILLQGELIKTNSDTRTTSDSETITNFVENNEDEYENVSEKKTSTKDPTVSITNEYVTAQSIKDMLRDRRRQTCSMLKLRELNFNSPRTLPEIVTQLKQWSEKSPIAKWVDITNGNYTSMENPIYMMIVDDPTSGQIVSAKQTVMIVAGIQGRDHHAVAAAMYVLYQLIESSEAHANLLTKYRFWVIPVFNPDGYDYSMKFPHRREWKKNLRQTWDSCKGRESCYSCEIYGLRCTVQPCYGVNLDRNFEYQWIPAEELRTEHPCGELYAGTRQLSEPETRAMTQYLHKVRTMLFTFIAFKEGDVLGIMYPYSHTRKKRAFDHIYRQRASRAASAAYSITGRPYMAGQTSEFLPLYAGGIEDWVDGHLGIDNTYTVMMYRPSDAYNSKLITERVVHEAYAAVDTLLLQSVEPLGPQMTVMTKRNNVGLITANCSLVFILNLWIIQII